MKISSNFDSGNIDVIEAGDPRDVRLRIRRDSNSDFFQWFHFRVTGTRGQPCRFTILNAAEAAYPKGWEGYRACASYDRMEWFRVPTGYDGKLLTFEHTPAFDSVYYAYFAPFPLERHRDLVALCQTSPRCRLEVLGETLDGDDLDLLVIGEPPARGDAAADRRRACWVIGRQHPGETMAEWWMEGFLHRLLDRYDPVSRALLQRAILYVVPNMNPDGCRRGNLRTNAAGANLNREWADPTMERSPEVLLVRRRMEETGVDFALDVHGDEALPYVFIAGTDHLPFAGEQQAALLAAFRGALERVNPDFQSEHGYPRPGKVNLSICSSYLADRFRCLAMTLEMPFKDNANAQDEIAGWCPERSRKLGASCLDALFAVIGDLR